MRGLRFIFVAAVAFALLVVGGCGGGSSTSTTNLAQQKAKNFRLARAMVPVTGDFPAGWTLEGYRVRASDTGEGCAVPQTGLVETAHVIGGYHHGDHPQVVGAATIFQTPAQATTAFQRATHYGAHCFATGYEQAARQSENAHRHVTSVSFTRFGFPTVGDHSAAYRLVVSWKIDDKVMSNHLDLVYFRIDRGVGALVGGNENAPFDQQLLRELARTVAQRGQSAA